MKFFGGCQSSLADFSKGLNRGLMGMGFALKNGFPLSRE
jgi:hypothetical protein